MLQIRLTSPRAHVQSWLPIYTWKLMIDKYIHRPCPWNTEPEMIGWSLQLFFHQGTWTQGGRKRTCSGYADLPLAHGARTVYKAVKRLAGHWVGSGRPWSFLADLQTSVSSYAYTVPKIHDCFCCHCHCLERDVTVEESEPCITSPSKNPLGSLSRNARWSSGSSGPSH